MLSFCPLQLNSSSQSKIKGKATHKDPMKHGSELYCSNRVQLSPTKMFVRVCESVKFSCQEKILDDTNFKFTTTGVKLGPSLSGLSIFPLGSSFMIFFLEIRLSLLFIYLLSLNKIVIVITLSIRIKYSNCSMSPSITCLHSG